MCSSLSRPTLVLVLTALVGVACAPPPDRGIRGDAPQTVSYLVASLAVPEPDAHDRMPGFDLDGIDEPSTTPTTCEERSIDWSWDGSHGVDAELNGYSLLYQDAIGVAPGVELTRALAEDRLSLVIEVRGVNAHDDGAVEVALLAATPSTRDDGFFARARIEHDANGRVRPGQHVLVRELAVATGHIEGTRVRVRFDSLAIPVRGAPVPLLAFDDLGATELAFDLAPGPSVRGGVLGTSFSIDRMVAELSARGSEGAEDALRELLTHIADIAPSASDPMVCTRASATMTFDAVSVVVDGASEGVAGPAR